MRTGLLHLLLLAVPAVLAAQPGTPTPTAPTGFLPGGRPLFALDLANTPIGEIPASIKLLQGTLEVVLKDGVPMLKASSASEVLIPLPQGQALPPDFTLEFAIVPKACCNPADLGIGEVNQGAASAHIEWDSDGQLRAVGGGDLYQAPIPEDFKAALPGVLTQVTVSFQGTTVKLYTNGRRLFTLERSFARKRELRVSLGGINDGSGAVYLASLRILPGAVASGPIAGGSTTSSQVSSQSQTASGGGRVVPNVAVTMGSGGPLVTWGLLGGASSYTVKRWKLNDTCCNARSAALTGPPWQDVALAVAGTYVYEVTATNPGWTATGQAQFVQFKSPGQIATVAPAGTIAPTNPAVVSGVTGVTSSSAAPPNSAIRKILPPPPRVIAGNSVDAAGVYGLVSPKTVPLPPVAGSGGFGAVAPRTVALASIAATGVGLRTIRTLPGTMTNVIPAPRAITLPGISAAGGTNPPPPQTISLPVTTASGNFWAPPPRVFTLAGWTATGILP